MAHGLLHDLHVRQRGKDEYEIVAAGRRLAALRFLVKRKLINDAMKVPCQIMAGDDAAEISLAGNVMRLPMHPADQYDAFKALADSGKGPEEIAARFGIAAQAGKQRLKLAAVSPRLLAL